MEEARNNIILYGNGRLCRDIMVFHLFNILRVLVHLCFTFGDYFFFFAAFENIQFHY